MGDWQYLLGTERYQAFSECCNGAPPSGVKGLPTPVLLHEHNAAVATSILRSVALLEVPLRNVLSTGLQELADRAGVGGKPWFFQTLPSKLANDKFAQNDVANAMRAGAKVARRQNRPLRDGDVIAAFSLGFWTKLVSHGCDDLWPRGLYRQFPNWAGVTVEGASTPDNWRRRKWLHDRLAYITTQRNRSAHHDRVFDADLKKLRRYLVATSGVISPSLAGRVSASWTADQVAKSSPLITTG